MNNRTFFKLLDEENSWKYMKNEFETKEFNLTKYTDLVIFSSWIYRSKR